MKTEYPVKLVAKAGADLAEGPVWDEKQQRLWWVDILIGRVLRTDPETGHTDTFDMGVPTGCFAFCESGRVVVARTDDLVYLDPETGEIAPLLKLEDDRPTSRFNDGKCDPRGRLWFGSVDTENPGTSSLYCYDPRDGSVAVRETGVTISNGLGWSPDEKTLYYTDTPQKKIWAYDYDADSGEISNRRVLIDLNDRKDDVPDGHCMDNEGNVWSAQWGNGSILKISPEGELLEEVSVPTRQPTSCVFGGPDQGTLFVTSAGINSEKVADPATGIADGDIFSLKPGVTGKPFSRLKDT